MTLLLRADFESQQLRSAARKSKDAAQDRRLLALAAAYDGGTRTDAVKIGGVTLQIIRDWVVRFNTSGPDGLIDRNAPGPPSMVEQHASGSTHVNDRSWFDRCGPWGRTLSLGVDRALHQSLQAQSFKAKAPSSRSRSEFTG
jgi:hypothetical protein